MSRVVKTLFLMVAALAILSVPARAQTLKINSYSQNDKRWKDDPMGDPRWKIGLFGCMMVSEASAYRVSPKEFNQWLSTHGGYRDGALVHDVAANYDGPGGLIYKGPGKLPATASAVGRGIARGAVYIVESKRPLSRNQKHWVLVYKATSGQAYYMDPWDATTRRVGDGWVSYGANARIYSF